MAQVSTVSIGIETDPISIRAAKLILTRSGSKVSVQVAGLSELRGDFATDDNLSTGIKKIKEKIGLNGGDKVVTCLSGKQVYVAQIPFRKMPQDEMRNALRLELKKNLPFEAMGAFIDYQILEEPEKKDEVPVIVTAVPNIQLTRHLSMMDRLGIKPHVVEVMPLAVANSFMLSQQSFAVGMAYVVIHIGPTVATLIICGDENVPFFHRNIYFSFDDLFAAEDELISLAPDNVDRTFKDLTDEISRSISFYEKTYAINTFAGVYLLGEYLKGEQIQNAIGSKTRLQTEVIDVFSRLKQSSNAPQGKFEIALAMAMRNAE